jgi:hypothetical protein
MNNKLILGLTFLIVSIVFYAINNPAVGSAFLPLAAVFMSLGLSQKRV